MPSPETLLVFAAISLGMVLTPGPNMVYLVSRSISQGRLAGLLSLIGVALGFVFYMLSAALGITAFLATVPLAYDAVRFAGAAFLLYLAWQAFTGRSSPFAPRDLPRHDARRLVAMGFLTNLLNPKIAVMYLSLLPQFIDPARGGVFGQAVALGFTQICVSVAVNAVIVMAAAHVASFLAGRPLFARAQRWVMGTVLAGLAARMAGEARP
ncbi:LysE family translocator [Roseococcus sp. SYP-B2431]|uniref:LysE family translocator n=1 Tax=Roseococcus sp. SYP-B2431 TaxID=2496640 RepID=UPI00103E9E74|nr:LysE family translocator [Roseococcus sp. SYP-B2431]TCH97876.1 LysE family translocator [Roseococcus sp. SYP-B2431]